MNLYKNAKFLTNLTLSLTLAALIPVSTVYAKSAPTDIAAATLIRSNAEAISENMIAELEKIEAEKAAAEKEAAEKAAREAAEKEAAEKAAYEAAASSYEAPTYTQASSGEQLTASKGVVYYNGHRETYYSQNVLPGTGLNIPGRHVAEDGTVRDADNYICVASSDLAKGSIVETSLGTAKVYDSGCASGTIDIYTNW